MESETGVNWVWLLLLLNAFAFGIAFSAAIVLLQVLARPWRKSVGLHWSERVRLAYTPGMTVLLLAAVLGPILGAVGDVILEGVTHVRSGTVGLLTIAAAGFAGVISVRYIWLRELWGSRVTIKSWLAGSLIMWLAIMPGPAVVVVLAVTMPERFGFTAVMIFCSAVLLLVLFEYGGEVKFLRFIGIVKPAPPAVEAMVQALGREMSIVGEITVFVLEWAQVNAVAWRRYRAVGFSRALLEVMTDNEVRAITAHELAHLLEPRWVARIKMIHPFAYLPVVPLIKYGGPWGIPSGYFLFLAVVFGYIRFTHRFEKRADKMQSDAIADPAVYAAALTKLHQANAVPAVMPGKQTHPHLYDRLLAGGIQPDFPRPKPPSRARPMLAVAAAIAAVLVLFFVMLTATFVALRLSGHDITLDRRDRENPENVGN